MNIQQLKIDVDQACRLTERIAHIELLLEEINSGLYSDLNKQEVELKRELRISKSLLESFYSKYNLD